MDEARSTRSGSAETGVTRRRALGRLSAGGVLAVAGAAATAGTAAGARQEPTDGAPALEELARAVVAAINAGDAEALDAWVAEDFVGHAPVPLPGAGKGLAGVKENLAALRAAFPDAELTVEDIVAEDDTVVVRGVFRGTHEGEFIGVPATGAALEIPGVCVARVVDGKAVEYWSHFNQLVALEQAGLFSLDDVTAD
jgi:steroid delta-isomerase-like uncharacterized protein